MPLFEAKLMVPPPAWPYSALKPLVFHRKFGDSLDRRRVDRNPGSGQGARGVGGNAIQRGAVAGRLTAAQA